MPGNQVHVPDGDDVALGAKADTAVVTDADGTVSAKLRGIVKLLVDKITVLVDFSASDIQLDDTDKLAVSLYGKSSTAGDTVLKAHATYGLAVALAEAGGAMNDGETNSIDWPRGLDGGELWFPARPYNYNKTTWDRPYNNVEVSLLASGARTAETSSADQVNHNGRGLIIYVDWTAETDTVTLTPRLQVKDSIGGGYHTVWTAAVDLTAIGDYVYLFVPGGAAGSYTEAVNLRVGRTWRFQMGVGDTDSATYSVSAVILV